MALIPLGVDLRSFRPNRAAGEAVLRSLNWDSNGPPVIGYLGRFVPEKGVGFLTSVLDRIEEPWRALFVGGGPDESLVRAWAARYPDRARVLSVRHDDVPAHLNALDILAVPSQTYPHWREQFGRMLIEAFACGVPVVASDSGEIPYVVGDAGAIAGEKDENGWISRLTEMLSDSGRRSEYAARGLERVGRFAWQEVGRRHVDFFDDILARKGTR